MRQLQRRVSRRLSRRGRARGAGAPSAPISSRGGAPSSSRRIEGDYFTILGLPLLPLLDFLRVQRRAADMTAARSGKARLAGVIGWPVAHSRSPRLHGFWLAAARHRRRLSALRGAAGESAGGAGGAAGPGLAGASMSPCRIRRRRSAWSTRASEAARRIGAVNTIVVGEDGALEGSNTDGFGFIEHLQAEPARLAAEGGPAVLLGAGGAARAIAVALLDAGVPEIRLVNRTAGPGRRRWPPSLGGARARLVGWDERGSGAGRCRPAGQQHHAGHEPASRRSSSTSAALPRQAVVYDIVYVPLETPLLAAARAARQCRGRWARHAAASGAAGLRRLVRRRARGDAGACATSCSRR